MNHKLVEGLTSAQLRTIRVRTLFTMVKIFTDFVTAAGASFSAAAIEAKGMPTLMVIIVCVVGGIVIAAKNLGDTLSAALPPPVMVSLDKKE